MTSSGSLVRIQAPEDGRPLSTTLPVGRTKVGCVMVPITGVPGVAGLAGINTFADAAETQPAWFVTVKL